MKAMKMGWRGCLRQPIFVVGGTNKKHATNIIWKLIMSLAYLIHL